MEIGSQTNSNYNTQMNKLAKQNYQKKTEHEAISN